MAERLEADAYFFELAKTTSLRSTCPRAQVGAILVIDGSVVVTGYNGSEPKAPHCIDVGCFMVDGHCERTIHAEENALLQAARRGVAVNGATLYCTLKPCYRCAMRLRTAGVADHKWLYDYKDREGI